MSLIVLNYDYTELITLRNRELARIIVIVLFDFLIAEGDGALLLDCPAADAEALRAQLAARLDRLPAASMTVVRALPDTLLSGIRRSPPA